MRVLETGSGGRNRCVAWHVELEALRRAIKLGTGVVHGQHFYTDCSFTPR
jgi:hypothetical protein